MPPAAAAPGHAEARNELVERRRDHPPPFGSVPVGVTVPVGVDLIRLRALLQREGDEGGDALGVAVLVRNLVKQETSGDELGLFRFDDHQGCVSAEEPPCTGIRMLANHLKGHRLRAGYGAVGVEVDVIATLVLHQAASECPQAARRGPAIHQSICQVVGLPDPGIHVCLESPCSSFLEDQVVGSDVRVNRNGGYFRRRFADDEGLGAVETDNSRANSVRALAAICREHDRLQPADSYASSAA